KQKIQKEEWVLQSRKMLGLIQQDEPATILARIKQRGGSLDLERIGTATPENKDDLQRIKNISPFEESKLNALGIFSFQQLINLQVDDVAFVNGAIEIENGRMMNEDWVAQAERLLQRKEKESLHRIRERTVKLDFDRIGKSRRGLKDNLQIITGISAFTEQKLNVIGIFSLAQIVNLTKEDLLGISELLELDHHQIDKDDWVEQAKTLLLG
ncbi:MAG: hypothetical protein AB8G15_19960, partial [Saprospiraceae bacterium]